MMSAGDLHRLSALARAHGRAPTSIIRRAIYGTRYFQPLQADEASSQRSAIGTPPHSVWDGPPRSADPGAPILRRAQR